MRCHICKTEPREIACQPFGPDDHISFMALGHHYRGFPVFGICRHCEQRLRAGDVVTVRHKGLVYAVQQQPAGQGEG